MTATHTDFDSANPQGSQSPTAYATSDLNNLRALRDMIIAGLVPGFIQTRTTGTGPDATRPQFITWNNGTLAVGFRWNMSWTGFQVTSIQEEWQNDGVPNWVAVDSAMALTYDASNNITASTNHGGFVNVLLEVWVKCLKVVSDFATHSGATGTAVHGLGTCSTQNANAIAHTGGTQDAVDQGNTTRGKGQFKFIVEDNETLTPGANAGVTVDWSKGGSKITINGTNAITFSNIPTGEAGHSVDVSNFNSVTWPAAVDWGVGGIPSIAGRARVGLMTNDAGTKVMGAISWKAV